MLYACPNPVTNPQANKICEQMETYGAIVMDYNGASGLYSTVLGQTSTGNNPWNASDVSVLNGIPLSDWDVMTLGTVY
jgi:hypothetical protein